MWKPMWNPIWSVCENMCEFKYEHVKFLCHSVRIYMWKPVWNPMWSVCENMCERVDIVSHPFQIYFTMQNFTCMWNMCVKSVWKCVKNVWKECENKTIFTRFFTWCFTYILLVVKLSNETTAYFQHIPKCVTVMFLAWNFPLKLSSSTIFRGAGRSLTSDCVISPNKIIYS